MKLSHLDTKQHTAIQQGSLNWDGWTLCGTSVSRRAGECRCDSCQMPVTLNDKGHWTYK